MNGMFTMALRYSDIEWNNEPVVWYITCCNIVPTLGNNVETPVIHEADEEVQDMCDDFKDEVAKMIKKPIQKLDADSFAVTVAADSGIHFYIKASISSMEYVHLRIHRPFSYSGEEPKLESVLANRAKKTPLSYF